MQFYDNKDSATFFFLVCLGLVNLIFLTSKGLSCVWWGHSHDSWYSLDMSVPQWFIHVSKFNLYWDFIIALEAEKSKIEALAVLVCGRVCFLLPTRTSMYLFFFLEH